MSRISRRKFMRQSLAMAGATFVVSHAGHRVLGANDTIHVAVTGCGGRGGHHLGQFLNADGCEVTWCVDPDERRAGGAADKAKKKQGKAPRTTSDLRKALDDKDLDAVTCATCNHWHTLSTIWAVQAGKDMYVEKPVTHRVHEGRVCTDLIAKSDCIVQVGMQSRSSGHWAKMAELTRSGKLGKLKVSHGIASKPRGGIGHKKPKDPPDWLDWNLWVGPSPMQPYHENLVHYNWHWFWDFGNGEIGNQGVHQMDIARWALADATWPTYVMSVGGRIKWDDQGQTPNVQLTVFRYGDRLLVFENCNLVSGKTRRVTNDFVYEKGKIIDGNKFQPAEGSDVERVPDVDVDLGPGGGHFGNFIAAMRSRKKGDLNAPYEEGRLSSGICHFGAISWRLGKERTWSDVKDPFEDDYANEQLDRINKQLKEEQGLDLSKCKMRVGPALKFDPKTEKFVDAPAKANEMLTRPPRPPFDVPASA
ncbi:MAG: Gfo/Idh/MocA family oxidoreductase [Planctomycetota bacterium]|nr:Gfo/Idh/MocA family oxidoreductase [Planctomycetota bacterium]